MRKFLLLLLISVTFVQAQTTVDLSYGAGYADEVYFKFSDASSSTYTAASWDVAFLRESNMNQAIRINAGKGLAVYEISNNTADWATVGIDTGDATALYNSDVQWDLGAFNTGSATYGWGEYNPVTHAVTGTVIFLISNTVNSTYYKFMIENYYGGYNIKYALWNGEGWNDDVTTFVANTSNNTDKFNYLNLESGELVDASPAASAWDLNFARYYTDVQGMQYLVTGVLQNEGVTVAEVAEATDAGWATDLPEFSEDINTIGYDWKALNASWSYDIVPDQVFYVNANDVVYRLYFNSFAGSSTGNFSFTYDVEDLAVNDLNNTVKFGIFPNPVKDNQINIVYENTENQADKAVVTIYNLVGQKVFETVLNDTTGFYQKNVQLNNLPKGNYILNFTQGQFVKSEKLLVK